MKSERVLDALGQVNDKYIVEAAPGRKNTEKATSVRVGRRLSTAIIAAVIALCLIGAGVAAVLYGDSIQTWFAHQWEAITGQSMSKSHAAVIDHLSQEVGISQTVGDVTITVDSTTVGDDNFFLLLRVEGMGFSDKHSYDFELAKMETSPDPLTDGAFVGYGIDYLGVDGNGAALLLLNYEYVNENGYSQDTRPLQVWLRLQNLVKDAHTDKQETLLEGEWYFSFVIDRSQPPEVVSLPDTEVPAMVMDTNEEVPVVITNIELTNTGLRFQYNYNEGELFISDQRIVAVLKNGNIIGNNGGIGSPTAGNVDMSFTYQWIVPINLDEIAFVQIGDIQISVS